MFRRGVLAVAVAATLVCAAAAAEEPAPGSVAESAGQKTYAKFSGKRLYKPSKLFFGAHEVITSISWSKWGKKQATGAGTYQVNNCIPNCAEGTITPTPSTIYLTGRMRCGGYFIFKRMKVYFAGHRRTSLPFCK